MKKSPALVWLLADHRQLALVDRSVPLVFNSNAALQQGVSNE
jgi:hypothetical protein